MFKKIVGLCLCLGLLCGAAVWAQASEAVTPCEECETFETVSDAYQHWDECTVCGTKTNYEFHSVSCEDKTECLYCGAKDCKYNDIVHGDEVTYTFDTVRHYEKCVLCEETITYDAHASYCASADTCYVCEAKGITPYTVVHGDYEIKTSQTEHWEVCADCGEEQWRDTHAAYCDAPEKCGYCDLENCTLEAVLHSGSWEMKHNSSDHWLECTVCHAADESTRDTHTEECPNVGTCVVCGAEDCNAAQTNGHTWEKVTPDDADACSKFVCSICDKERTEGEHSFWCTDTATCYNCGTTGLEADEANIYHEHLDYESDKDSHWQVCADCGTDLKNVRSHQMGDELAYDENGHYFACVVCGAYDELIPHSVECTDETVCAYCGYENADGVLYDGVLHGTTVTRYDEVLHWEECELCGEEAYGAEEHSAVCSNPTRCAVCGQEIADISVNGHVSIDWSKVYTDANYHWYKCAACGEDCQKTEHLASCAVPTKCDFCQMTGYTGDNIFHDGTYNGYGDGSGTYKWEDLDTHVYLCGWCGDPVETWYHVRDGKGSTTCRVCKGTMACEDEDHVYKYVYVDEAGCIDTCTLCGFTYGFAEDHVTEEGDPEGICSRCGEAFGTEATPTPEPDEPTPSPMPDAPTPEPDEPTPSPMPDAPTPVPDVTGEVVETLPETQVKEPTLVLPEGTEDTGSVKLIYEVTEKDLVENTMTYEVSFVDENNEDVDLPGVCTLVFPYPAGMSESDRNLYFITIRHTRDDGEVDVFTSQDGSVLFLKQGLGVKVKSLSPFEITWQKNTAVDNLPATGDTAAPYLYLTLLAAGAAAVTLMRKKTRRA